MMTSSQIRQSFLDFFKSKQHTIVPSSSLMPDAPNLLFTNAGMNQFVPIFLGQQRCPYNPPRAADTQKCIRAGGKHNDLEDVGLDTYHHTFFEMLGNWSFGDYFKKEAIEWAWELVTGVWKFPKERLYATVFCPVPAEWETTISYAIEVAKQRIQGVPVEIVESEGGAINRSDKVATAFWAEHFLRADLNPLHHILPGNRKDNFWMMGETGPCGPCSEIHVDLTPKGDTKGSLVNKGDARCIEIWNLVFIQFNANPDGTFSPLPARHVDTGMGFERVTSIIQGTKNFTDFANAKISNYETDIFRPLFDKIEQLSGMKYGSTLPSADPSTLNPQQKTDIAFRVIADHIRTLSFAIADGIQPGNTDRNYVLRRILRRAVRYGRTLGFHEPFFYKLVGVLAETMGHVFPEIREKQKQVEEVIRVEEEAFNKTLDEGIHLFEEFVSLDSEAQEFCTFANPLLQKLKANKEIQECLQNYQKGIHDSADGNEWRTGKRKETHKLIHDAVQAIREKLPRRNFELWKRVATEQETEMDINVESLAQLTHHILGPLRLESLDFIPDTLMPAVSKIEFGLKAIESLRGNFRGKAAFLLYDTYGFPLDLTELMARERGLTVDVAGFNNLMEEQRGRARKAQKKEAIELTHISAHLPATKFLGYNQTAIRGKILDSVRVREKAAVVLDQSVFYAEAGGQVGDTGILRTGGRDIKIINTQKIEDVFLHIYETDWDAIMWGGPTIGTEAELQLDARRREAIQRHHTVTHLLHWALHEVINRDASQKGSYVGPEKLTFDFNNAPLTPQQLADIEKLVNERILENASVSWTEVPYAEIKNRKDVMQFFGEKYSDTVRVVQIGGQPKALDGYSMELCGGTHTRATGEIGLFRIVGENAIAAGVRRIEAVAGLEAYNVANQQLQLIKSLAGKINSPVHELEKKIESLLTQQRELEKQLKAAQQKQAAETARSLIAKAQTIGSTRAIIENLGPADGDYLQAIADALKGQFKGVVVLGGVANNAVSLIATVSPDLTSKIQAGKIIQTIAPIVGGKGGGKPDNARGGGKDASKLDEALAKAREVIM